MSDPRKHGYLSNRAGQQAANEKELRDEISRLKARLGRALDGFREVKVNADAQKRPKVFRTIADEYLRELDNGDD